MRELDLNCDMGEGFGLYQAGDDPALHGDQPNALRFAQGLRAALQDAGVTVCAPQVARG